MKTIKTKAGFMGKGIGVKINSITYVFAFMHIFFE